MADPKKNPLLGAFRAPVAPPPKEDKPPTEPPKEGLAPSTTIEPKAATPAAPGKPAEPPQEKTDGKPPATGATTPGKPGAEKKPAEPPQEKTDGKPPATGATVPGKPGEEKKSPEPPKVKAGGEPPAAGPSAPGKPGEEKKPPEPPKEKMGGEPPAAGPATPGKPGEEKKAPEPPKETTGGKPPAAGPATPSKPGEEKKPPEAPKPAEPPKSADKDEGAQGNKVVNFPKAGEEKSAEVQPPTVELDDDGIPKDFSMQIVGDDKLGKVTTMSVDVIDDFEGHPFPVVDDEDMDALVKSIKQVGILEPATIIRNSKKFGRFEMVAGHRRMHAAKLAGLSHIPVIVRDMDHDEATIYMVDSNLKREKPLTPMEKARAYTMRSEALKRKTGRRSKEEVKMLEATGHKPKTADEQLAEQTGESVATVQRYKTLTKLAEPLQKMVDTGKIPVNTAADIAQMKKEEQEVLADAIQKEDKVPSGTVAKELKQASKEGVLTKEKIEKSVAPTKRELEPPLKVTLNEEDLRPYFSDKTTTVPDVKQAIFEALNLRKKAIERRKAKEQEEKEGGKKKTPAPAR